MVRMVRKFEVGGVYHAGGVPYKVTRISADREFAWFREPGKEERRRNKIQQHMTRFPEYIWSEEADPPLRPGQRCSIIPPTGGIRATALVFYDLTEDLDLDLVVDLTADTSSDDDEHIDWGESDEETDLEEEVDAAAAGGDLTAEDLDLDETAGVDRAAKSQRIE